MRVKIYTHDSRVVNEKLVEGIDRLGFLGISSDSRFLCPSTSLELRRFEVVNPEF
jgi:hypothetical protein